MRTTVAANRGGARLLIGLVLLVLGPALVVAGPARAEGTTIRVPQDHATVQAAVDAAQAGDLVLIDAGVYHEEVFIPPEHPGDITIRGVDRDEVVFDGRFELGTAIEAQADGVVMENMTARNYAGNGFYWQSVDGFRGSYLTAYRIGVYAIFSFDAVNGVFEHSYASGSADAAWYVGQCHPCNITLRNVVGEYSALGYSGTNAGGNLFIEDSVFRNNGTGILPNSLTTEANPPQRELTIRNNVVEDNSNLDTPAKGLSATIVGVGIGIAGGNDNVVENNIVSGHSKYGIAIFPLPEGAPPEGVVWVPSGNKVIDNTVTGSGEADLTMVAGSGANNCFAGNDRPDGGAVSTEPPGLTSTHACDLPGTPPGGSPVSAAVLGADFAQYQFGERPSKSYEEMPDAPPQEEMPVEAAGDGGQPAGEPEPDPASLPATGGGAVLTLVGLGLAASGLRLRRSRT